jgi:DNA-binding NtrC family response regulator
VIASTIALSFSIHDGLNQDLIRVLNGFRIDVPVLEKRSADISLLVDHFLKLHGSENQTVSPQAMRALLKHDWLGDIRQLENVIRCAAFIGLYLNISVGELPRSLTDPHCDWVEDDVLQANPAKVSQATSRRTPENLVENARRTEIESALRESTTRKEAARRLNISPATLFRRMRDFGL